MSLGGAARLAIDGWRRSTRRPVDPGMPAIGDNDWAAWVTGTAEVRAGDPCTTADGARGVVVEVVDDDRVVLVCQPA